MLIRYKRTVLDKHISFVYKVLSAAECCTGYKKNTSKNVLIWSLFYLHNEPAPDPHRVLLPPDLQDDPEDDKQQPIFELWYNEKSIVIRHISVKLTIYIWFLFYCKRLQYSHTDN